MLQTLFYIPAEFHGWPVFGWGLLLVAWLIASAAIVLVLTLRQGFNADTRSYLPVMLLVAGVIVVALPLMCEPRGLPIRGYGMMILLAVLSALGLAIWRARRCGVDPDFIFTLAFWMILPGILGARVVYVAEYWRTQYWPAYVKADTVIEGVRALLFQICNVANGGLVVYGAFIGGALGIMLFRRAHSLPLLATMDLVAPSVLIGASIGRVGCLLNGCCYGGHCELPWKVTFPWNSPVFLHQVEVGEYDPLGIEFGQGHNRLPMISRVAPGSIAAREHLVAGVELLEINGMNVGPDPKSDSSSLRKPSEETSPVEKAQWALKQIDKLNFIVARGDHTTFSWLVDDAPDGSIRDDGQTTTVQVYGFSVVGKPSDPPKIDSVVSQTPEAAAGLLPGQRIVSVGGIPAPSVGELAALVERHRHTAWLYLRPSGGRPPIELDVARPLPRSLDVHPTQVYSSIDALLLCLLLLAYDNFRRRDGELAALTLTFYPIARFLVEGIRTDEPPIWGTPFTISQNISIAILCIAVALWIYILRRPPEMAFERKESRG